jgi:hypothetical protein
MILIQTSSKKVQSKVTETIHRLRAKKIIIQ